MISPGAQERESRDATPIKPPPALSIVLLIIFGIVLSAVVFLFVHDQETHRVEQDFESRARTHAQIFASTLHGCENTLHTLRDLFMSSDYVDFTEFTRTATDLRERHAAVQCLEWIPNLLHPQREALENRTRSEIHPAFHLREKKEGQKELVAAETRESYLPVLYCEPLAGNEGFIGYDELTGDDKTYLLKARDTGRIVASPRRPLRLPATEEHPTEYGWRLFLPLYSSGSIPSTEAERRQKFIGVVAGEFQLSELVRAGIDQARSSAVETLLLDMTDHGEGNFLIYASGSDWRSEPPPDPHQFRSGPSLSIPLEMPERRWLAAFRPVHSWREAQTTGYSYAFLLGGLLLTGMLASLVYSAQRRASIINHMVNERTAELRATKVELERDIQRRDAAERALRASEERYRALIANSTEAIWRYELEIPLALQHPESEQLDHLYKYAYLAEANDAFARMYGHQRADQIVGARLSSLLPRTDPVNIEHLRDYLRCHFRMENSESHELDHQGQIRIFLNNVVGIVENGYLVRAWGTQRDITEQRKAEAMRHENEARLRLALSAADMGTWEWDVQQQRVSWSADMDRIYGLPPGGFDGTATKAGEILHPDDRERVGQLFSAAANEGHEVHCEYRVVRPDGAMRWVSVRGDVIRDDNGRVIRIIGAGMDVTDQRQAAEDRMLMEKKLQETQKLESLGILAGGIAHDFNNLLTGVLGNASLARLDLPSNSPAHVSLEAIEKVAVRAAELCKQMLAYSGKGQFVVQRLDLSQLVEETAELIQVSISKSAILKLALSRQLPSVSADATQIRQIIMNLVINASDAIGEKSGVITISTGLLHADKAYITETHLSPTLPEGDYVYLEVSDNGCGMDAATKAKIFDPFFTTKFTGRGLGLAAVLGIVRGHNGALKVYSEQGKGTTFKLLLPCADGPAEPLDETMTTGTWRGSGLILVVDDEDTVRNVGCRMLESMGFETARAANGLEAVEIFRKEPERFAAVLLDLTMPQMDGNEAFTELRRIRPDVRVLLISGFNEQDAINRFAGKGLSGFLQKPFKHELLRAKLRSILEAPQPS